MKRTAKTFLLTAAILLLAGADGPKDAKTPAPDAPKDAAKVPLTREQTVRAVCGPWSTIHPAFPSPGVRIEIRESGRGKEKGAMALLPLFPETVELSVETPVTDADLIQIQGLKNLRSLGFRNSPGIKGDGLKYLAGLEKMRSLDIMNTAVGDNALRYLVPMTRLESLSLGRNVTQRGLAALKPLKRLQWLLFQAGIGDEGVAQLVGCPSLEHIRTFTTVTDDGFRNLGRITTLKELDLAWMKTPVTDAEIANLAELTDLERLDLVPTGHPEAAKITDAALETVAKFHMLRELSLSGPGITDAGLRHIKGLRRLQDLWLTDTRITAAGLHHLEAMPVLLRLGLIRATSATPGWRRSPSSKAFAR